MVEKFSDFETKTEYLNEEGTFMFEIKTYELRDGAKGPMAVFTAQCDAGQTTLFHSLNEKARWSYNSLIKSCLNLTAEQCKTFELDYQTIGNELIGKKFIGDVEADVYEKVVKVANDDGTFTEEVQAKETYRVVKYHPIPVI